MQDFVTNKAQSEPEKLREDLLQVTHPPRKQPQNKVASRLAAILESEKIHTSRKARHTLRRSPKDNSHPCTDHALSTDPFQELV